MADRVQYLEYAVYMSSKDEAERYQAAYPNGVRIAPDDISTQLGIPVVLHSLTTPFTAPSIRSAYFTATSKYPRNVAEFHICRGGWFGICALFGRDTLYKWVAKYYWVATPVPTVEGVPVPAPAAMGARSWIDGFEMKADDAAGSWGGGNQPPVNRGSSRHVDGLGFAAHGLDDIGEYFQHNLTENGAANRRSTWERFYMRVRSAPTALTSFWQGANVANAHGRLCLMPGLQLAVMNIDVTSAGSIVATSSSALTLNVWSKIDILYEKAPVGGQPGRVRVYVKGVQVIDITVADPNGGISSATDIGGSRLGLIDLPYGTMAVDFDDWSSQPIPATLDGLDWLNGSRCSLVSPIALNAGNQFTGDYRSLLRNPFQSAVNPTAQMSDVTAGDALIVNTDAAYTIDKVNGALGCSAIKVKLVANGLTGTSQIGYSINGAAAVMTNFGEPNSPNIPVYRTAMYRPAQAAFADVTPLTLNFIREAPAGTKKAFCFVAEAELIGVFGDEDVKTEAVGTVTTQIPPRLGPHNNPYPDSIWARLAIPPAAPVIVVGGTYVGNGTGQDLTFRAPVSFFLSRRVAAGATRTGVNWWTSLIGSHDGTAQSIGTSAGMIRAAVDTTFVPIGGVNDPEERYVLRIAGDEINSNEAAIDYQYIAVIDPGARFVLNGSAHHQNAASLTETLKNATFTPEALWFFLESLSGGAVGQYLKGPGNAAAGATKFDSGNEIADVVTMAAGSLITGANGQLPEGVHFSYAAWRTNDGSGDPNVAKVVKVGTYIGNGTASRTIGFAPASGLRPLYAIVTPSAATATIRRDPSNTGTISTDTAGNDNAATGITSGGIDEMTVGLALNANGVVYNWFVLMGSATAGNNGWSINGEFIYIEPEYIEPPVVEPPEFVPVPAEPTEPPEPPAGPTVPDCEAGEDCVDATTAIVNLALMELGTDKVLTDYCTQDVREAVLARECYEQCVRHTLITYPWPFATKYAALALTAAQPANQDWAFAYRMPSDCIFPRRIVVARGAAVDPDPPPMGLSSDSLGGIIYANEAAAVLEYTARPYCVGSNGDDLFREALKWRVSAALAPALTRIPGEADRCLKMFEVIVQKAESVVKQGVPGLRAAASTLDTTAAALAANVQVVNMALVKIGARTIANLTTEQSREAVAANLVFEDTLRSVLRDFPWAFATRYIDPATFVDGSEDDPVSPDWTYAHRLPTDLVYLRRLVLEGTGRSFDPAPSPFRLTSDATGGLLYSNVEEPILEYTARLQNILVFADPLFREALSWKLAATLAPSLASVELHRPEQHGRGPETPQDPTRRASMRFNDQQRRVSIAQWATVMYERAIVDAKVADRNESQPEPDADAEWIRGRE